MTVTKIDTMYTDFNGLNSYLSDEGEVSYALLMEDYSRKILLLSAASYFESIFISKLIDFFEKRTDDKKAISNFIKNKALKRQYHTLFTWNRRNANSFFALFGEDFKKYIQEKLNMDADLEASIKSFLELGNERNRMVHNDFSAYYLEKSEAEIYDLYKKSLKFVNLSKAAC